MTPQEQQDFIDDLTRNVAGSIKKQIVAGKIPANWDGHELRALLADKFGEWNTLKTDKTYRVRNKAYKNTCIVENL